MIDDGLDIPCDLRVENRQPLIEAVFAQHPAAAQARQENWRRLELERIAARKRKNRERGALCRIFYGNRPRKKRQRK